MEKMYVENRIFMAHSKGKKDYKIFQGDYTRQDFKDNQYVVDFEISASDFEKYFDSNEDKLYEEFGDCNCNVKTFKFLMKIRKGEC